MKEVCFQRHIASDWVLHYALSLTFFWCFRKNPLYKSQNACQAARPSLSIVVTKFSLSKTRVLYSLRSSAQDFVQNLLINKSINLHYLKADKSYNLQKCPLLILASLILGKITLRYWKHGFSLFFYCCWIFGLTIYCQTQTGLRYY